MAQKVKDKKTGPGKQTGANKLTRLRAPEKQLAACVKRGEACDFDPKAPEKARTLRAEVIERLVRGQRLPGEKAALDLPPKGLAIADAKITGPLDLSCCDFPARLGFLRCEFDALINLVDARLRGLFLVGSSLNGLQAGRLTVEGSLVMRGIRSNGAVRLSGATITGYLSLRGATLENIVKDGAAIGHALNLQKLTVSGACHFETLAKPPIGHVDLRGMTASDLSDDGSLWPKEGQGDLWLDGFTYQRFVACPTGWRSRKSWLLRQAQRFLKQDFAPQPWVQCAKVLREMGHERDARILLYHMHEARRGAWSVNRREFFTRRFWKNLWRRFWSQVFRVTAGYTKLRRR